MTTKTATSLSFLTLLAVAGCGGQTDVETAQMDSSQSSTVVHHDVWKSAPIASPVLLDAPARQESATHAINETYMSRQSAQMVGNAALSVDVSDRESVRKFYARVFIDSPVLMGWNGSYAAGNAGSINPDYQRATIQRVNWYRAMAGVPASVTLSTANSAKAQKAIFMMSANNLLTHYPTPDLKFYTADGAEGALSSNMGLGYNGVDAIDAYMKDVGVTNAAAGHRRWMLFPGTKTLGTGDVPSETVNGQRLWGGNALWVMDADYYGNRPQVRDGFVAWPNRGFVPYQTVFARWSFSYPDADFSQAQVIVSHKGSQIQIRTETVSNSAGENTIVWQMPGIEENGTHVQPESDMAYKVSVSNVMHHGAAKSFSYSVVVFDTGPIMKGTFSSYTLSLRNSILTISDKSGIDGIQTVKDPQRVDFSDASLAFDFEGNAGKTYRLYRAAFNRKPDPSGLGFWIDAMDRNVALQSVAGSFVQSPEFASLYGSSPTHAQVVRALYANVLHREPDASGAAFWTRALVNGLSVEQLLIEFSESPENKSQVATEIASGILYKRFE